MAKPYAQMTKRERDGRNSATWKRMRKQRWDAGDRTCWLCGTTITDYADYTMDHIHELGAGGSNDPANVRPAHGRRHDDLGCPGNYGRSRRKTKTVTVRSRHW